MAKFEVLNSKKTISIAFFIAFTIVTIILVGLCKSSYELLLGATSFDDALEQFHDYNKQIAINNIISFFILIAIALWAFKAIKKSNYLLFSIILYAAVTLFNSVTLNKMLYALKDGNPSDYGAYWLLIFIGVFYIIGAVVVAAIGYITIRNFDKRAK